MSTRRELKLMTKAQLKSWLTDKNERLPGEDKLKSYYVKRALNVFERLGLSDDEEDDSNYDHRPEGTSSRVTNEIRRKRQSIQDGFSSGASGGSTGSRKRPIARRPKSRRASGESIVKTRRKTPVRKVPSKRSNQSNSSQKSSKKENKNTMNTSNTGSRSKMVAQRVRTQHKDSPALKNSIKRTRNRMRRATDNPTTLANAFNNSNNRYDDDSETESEDNNNNNNNNNNNHMKYHIDVDPQTKTIQQLKQWLTQHDIEYGQGERKAYYVNLARQYSESKDDTFNRNDFNSKNVNRGMVKRGISPILRQNRVKQLRQNNLPDSPPLPSNLDPSPLTPPDLKKLHISSRRGRQNAINNNIVINNDEDEDDEDDEEDEEERNRRNGKKGLLKTPALLKRGKQIVTDSSKVIMRNEIRKMLESSDNDGNGPLRSRNVDNDDDDSDEDDSDDIDNRQAQKEEEDDDDDEDETMSETRRTTIHNTLVNQYLGTKYYHNKLQREQKKQQKKIEQEKISKTKIQKHVRLQPHSDNINSNINNNHNNSNNNKNNKNNNGNSNNTLRSPFGMLSTFMSRISPRINRYGYGNNSNNINLATNDRNAPQTANVRHRLKYNDVDDEEELDDAMSPYSNASHLRNGSRGLSSEEAYLRSDEENIPTDPDSPSPPPYVPTKGRKNPKGKTQPKGKGKTKIKRQQVRKQIPKQQKQQNQQQHQQQPNVKHVQLPPNYLNTKDNGMNVNKEENDVRNGKNKSRSRCGTIVSVCVALIGILITFVLSSVFIDSIKQHWHNEQEFQWFCDVGKLSVNGEQINAVTGQPCFPCPKENIDTCANGHAICQANYRLSGKYCVQDSKAVRMAHLMELKARQILSQYKGRAECGEQIEPGLLESQLKAYVQSMYVILFVDLLPCAVLCCVSLGFCFCFGFSKSKHAKEFEGAFNLFLKNVHKGDMDIKYNEKNKRYYADYSQKTFFCEVKLFFVENLVLCLFVLFLSLLICYWIYKYNESRKCSKIANLMREYTFEVLLEQKMKNPSYKAVGQIKQDNMIRFGSLIGKNTKKRERIWHIVKDKFERDAYIQCSQRTVDGIQKLCWQISDTYLRKPDNLINNNLNNMNNNNNNNNINNDNGSNNYSMKFVENTPIHRNGRSSGIVSPANGMNPSIPQSPNHVYGVPINQAQKHSVTSPSRSFGMTPVIPRNRGGRMEAQNVQNGYHMNMPQFSKYNPWGH